MLAGGCGIAWPDWFEDMVASDMSLGRCHVDPQRRHHLTPMFCTNIGATDMEWVLAWGIIMTGRCRILAVDDDPMNIAVLEDLLEDYDLCTATTGPEALEQARLCRPDLILLDIMMPGMTGYEVCERLRQDESLRDVKIILVSAKATTAERIKGYDAGADDYVVKPFDCEELLAKVKVYLRLRSIEEVDRLKGSMLRLLRHEVRTPMTGMISGLEILADACPEDPVERKGMVNLVMKNVHRLGHLLEKVIELSALEAGERIFCIDAVDVSELARAVVNDKAPQAAQRDIEISVRNADPVTVQLDRTAIGQVLGELLDNAIRFSADGATVEVRIENADEQAAVSVLDHGKGIAPEALPHLFISFNDSDMIHHTKGTGLSLAIAQRIVQQHRGRIEVESDLGSGSCFTVILPVNQNSDPDARRACCTATLVA